MAKWNGKIGYVKEVEIEPGIWDTTNSERSYSGDLIDTKIKIHQTSESTNGSINIAVGISILADSFANENFGYMKYVEFKGALWNVTDVTPAYPRLILNIGGRYNGK